MLFVVIAMMWGFGFGQDFEKYQCSKLVHRHQHSEQEQQGGA
jgi:hypothetical protein